MRVSPSSERASGTEKRNAAPQSGGYGELCIMPHRAEALYHRALQVGWSRLRAVLMLRTF